MWHPARLRLGGLLASAYIAAALAVYGAAMQSQETHRQLVTKEADANKAWAQVQYLQGLVAMQQNEIQASRGVGLMRLSPGRWTTYTVTFYTPSGGEGDGLVTFTGKSVHEGWTVAVDPRVIPLGSVIEVRFPDGTDKILQALDTGGAIKGRHIDVFVWDEHQAVKLGVQRAQVRVLLRGK